MGMILWFASMAFGGINAAAWYDYFPSKAEAWLWQGSAVYIIWSGLVWLLINLVARICKPFDDYWNRVHSPQPPFAQSKVLVAVGYSVAPYMLLLACIWSLRRSLV